jgi:subtilase family serine protease
MNTTPSRTSTQATSRHTGLKLAIVAAAAGATTLIYSGLHGGDARTAAASGATVAPSTGVALAAQGPRGSSGSVAPRSSSPLALLKTRLAAGPQDTATLAMANTADADTRTPGTNSDQAPTSMAAMADDTSAGLSPQLLAIASRMTPPTPPRLQVVAVPEPSDIDAGGLQGSATQLPVVLRLPATSGSGSSGAQIQANDGSGPGSVTAAAAATTSVVYTPAQIRQAYGFGALPAATTANKGAYQGSGQVIVIIDAYHYANTGADLNTFSTKFGLPTCTLIPNTYKAGTAISALVTAPKAGEGCSFQTLYVTAAGAQSATAPATNASWATEIALDVQWAHAIAPNAKIVLVEAANNSGAAILSAMAFASKLGANVVSMSYGSAEYSGSPSFDTVMVGSPTWLASSGDNGAGVSWPAVSRNAVGVGGTLLSNVSPRAETAWSGSGGGRSAYVAMPSWQSTVTIPGNPTNTAANASLMRRGVPDVAYNASPYSGMYVYQNGWFSVGGTSAGAPQWAALVAVVNANRVLGGKAAFTGTGFQQALYGTAAASTNYKASFLDVSSGTNGTCTSCKASTGYDLVTGLGSPNVASLLSTLLALK